MKKTRGVPLESYVKDDKGRRFNLSPFLHYPDFCTFFPEDKEGECWQKCENLQQAERPCYIQAFGLKTIPTELAAAPAEPVGGDREQKQVAEARHDEKPSGKPGGLRQVVKELKDKNPRMTKEEVLGYLNRKKFDFKGKNPQAAVNVTWAFLGYAKAEKEAKPEAVSEVGEGKQPAVGLGMSKVMDDLISQARNIKDRLGASRHPHPGAIKELSELIKSIEMVKGNLVRGK